MYEHGGQNMNASFIAACVWCMQAAQYGDSQLVVTGNAVTIVVDPKAREGDIVPSVHAQVQITTSNLLQSAIAPSSL
jgi:hypothetical protein